MSSEYRIEFQITRRKDDEDDFTEIGFGSSGAWDDIRAALYSVESAIDNGEWETEGDQPDPETVMADVMKERGSW